MSEPTTDLEIISSAPVDRTDELSDILKQFFQCILKAQSKGVYSLRDSHDLYVAHQLFYNTTVTPETSEQKQKSLNLIFLALEKAQSVGTFTFKESHDIYLGLQTFRS